MFLKKLIYCVYKGIPCACYVLVNKKSVLLQSNTHPLTIGANNSVNWTPRSWLFEKQKPTSWSQLPVSLWELKMSCWICGNEAKSGEHKTKASDLRALYGDVSPNKPLFIHTDQKTNKKVVSIKSDKFKFDKSLCSHCNNARTSPHDKAWEQFSKYLREHKPAIKKGFLIYLDDAFPGTVSESMLNVHLFFVKLFGCYIVDQGIPIAINTFAEAIHQQKPHPKVFLRFGASSGLSTGMSNVETVNIGARCVYATWFYIIEPIAVNVVYSEPSEKREGLVNAWHPSSIKKNIYAVEF